MMKYFIFTHVHYDVAYHDSDIIEINVSTDPAETVPFLSPWSHRSHSYNFNCAAPTLSLIRCKFLHGQKLIKLMPDAIKSTMGQL